MIRSLFILCVTVALGGCGGAHEPEVPPDPVLEREADAGRTALALEQPQQAIAKFRDALARARERDDAGAIDDVGFNLAIAELRANQADAALKTTIDIEAELQRRGVTAASPLPLAQAVALYRTGRAAEADRLAARLEDAADPEAAGRAAFLRGLIADDGGNDAGLSAALGRISKIAGAEQQADAAELQARLLLRQGDAARARTAADHAADLRRQLLDYRSLARCLALEARAAERAGEPAAAADLYLRAGRIAAAQDDTVSAKRWLAAAIALSRDPAVTRAARSLLVPADDRRDAGGR